MAKVKYTTPKGVAQYPWLKEGRPDTKFDEEGFYRTNVVVDADAAKTLVDTINQYGKDNLGAKMSKAQLPYETDDVTGAVTFKMKSRYAPKDEGLRSAAYDKPTYYLWRLSHPHIRNHWVL